MNTRAKSFFNSEQGVAMHKELTSMVESKKYHIRNSYSPTTQGDMSFVDRHMQYMSQYPGLNCAQYISNLKLMTKIR